MQRRLIFNIRKVLNLWLGFWCACCQIIEATAVMQSLSSLPSLILPCRKSYIKYIYIKIYLYKIWNSKVTSCNWTQSLVRVFRKPIPQKNSCETVFLSWIVVSVHYHNTNLFLYRVTCMMNLLTATQPLSSPLSQYPTDALQLYRL